MSHPQSHELQKIIDDWPNCSRLTTNSAHFLCIRYRSLPHENRVELAAS